MENYITFESIVADMQSLGLYRPEYDTVIKYFVGLCEQYNEICERMAKPGFAYQTKSAQGGYKKSPVVAAQENLRKDILQFAAQLCLTPKSYMQRGSTQVKPRNALKEILAKLET